MRVCVPSFAIYVCFPASAVVGGDDNHPPREFPVKTNAPLSLSRLVVDNPLSMPTRTDDGLQRSQQRSPPVVARDRCW